MSGECEKCGEHCLDCECNKMISYDDIIRKDFAERCVILELYIDKILMQEQSNRVKVAVLTEKIKQILCTEKDFEGAKEQLINYFKNCKMTPEKQSMID